MQYADLDPWNNVGNTTSIFKMETFVATESFLHSLCVEEIPMEEAKYVEKFVEEVADRVKNWADEALKYLPGGKLRLLVLYIKQVAKFVGKLIRLPQKALKLEDKEKKSTTPQENSVTTTEKEDQK
ncbi:hypothetical protein CR513_43611, partial [Mucuna pruriens]